MVAVEVVAAGTFDIVIGEVACVHAASYGGVVPDYVEPIEPRWLWPVWPKRFLEAASRESSLCLVMGKAVKGWSWEAHGIRAG